MLRTRTSSTNASPFLTFANLDSMNRLFLKVSTIGFPLVGGPAGSMEGSRQAEIAKEILEAKDVPYLVAAPLLIQVAYHGTSSRGAIGSSKGLSKSTAFPLQCPHPSSTPKATF